MSNVKEVQNPVKKESSFIKKLLEKATVLSGVLIGITTIVMSVKHNDKFTFLHPHVPETWDIEAKITLLGLVSSCIGGFLLLCVMICGNLRFMGNYNPVGNIDPPTIQVMNRILQNSVEQILIFLPNLLYWTFKYSTEQNKQEVLVLGFLFLVGRVLFLIGYFVGTLLNWQTMRSLGMAMTYFPSLILIQRNLGFNLV